MDHRDTENTEAKKEDDSFGKEFHAKTRRRKEEIKEKVSKRL